MLCPSAAPRCFLGRSLRSLSGCDSAATSSSSPISRLLGPSPTGPHPPRDQHKPSIGVARAVTSTNVMGIGGNESDIRAPQVSSRVIGTDAPIITKTKAIMAGKSDVMSLAQGIVHWSPPETALAAVAAAAHPGSGVNQYGPTEGLLELREALVEKLAAENDLHGVDVMVTAGANQAYTNIVLTLTDATDRCVLFAPYYFNHLMAHQMTGGAAQVSFGPCDPATLHPDLDWLEAEFKGSDPPKLVTLINPNNPTGVLMSSKEVKRAAEICQEGGAWLVMDNTYEHFVYDNREHVCVGGPHVINIFSFSKAYGMMGWRMGYLAYSANSSMVEHMNKIQDTIPICATQISMVMALGAVQAGRGWVKERIGALEPNRHAILDALSPLGSLGNGVAGGEGAIYMWAKLPDGCASDEAVMRWLVEEHGVCIIPGSSCGCPGYIRVAFANLQPEECAKAASRLKAGLQQIVDGAGPAN